MEITDWSSARKCVLAGEENQIWLFARETSLRDAYAAFNEGDFSTALTMMSANVNWHNIVLDRREYGREAVRSYWRWLRRQLTPLLEPLSFQAEPKGRVAVEVKQTICSSAGEPLAYQHLCHVFTFGDGLIRRMDVRQPRRFPPPPPAANLFMP